eukprot:4316657-Amphidinium_carterae.1
MPPPAANVSSGHDVATYRTFVSVKDRVHTLHVFCCELGRNGPHAPARCPKGCPCAKTLCMAKDCRQTWHCSGLEKFFRF